MKIKAKYIGCRQDDDDSLVFEFSVNSWVFKRIEEQLTKDNEYIVDVTKPSKVRTLNQNALMWELLTKIDQEVNGTKQPWQWYVEAVKQTGAKTKVIYMQEESLDELKEMCFDRNGNIRAVEPLGQVSDLYAYRIYFGSSNFNTKEMSLLIDTVLDMAQLVGINRTYWEELLNE